MPAEAYRNVRLALGEARADGLLKEEDAGQVRPAELVLRRVCLAIRPLERLQHQSKRLSTRPGISMTSHVRRSPGGGPRARSSPGHRSSCMHSREEKEKKEEDRGEESVLRR